jgi:WD40 repeat protein
MTSDGRTVCIWDAATGAQLAVLDGQGSAILSAAFAPNDSRVVTASADNTARTWELDRLERGSAFEIACQRLGNHAELAEVRESYDLGGLASICGDNVPATLDLRQLK